MRPNDPSTPEDAQCPQAVASFPGPVLVTGGGGFIGHHLITALLARGCTVRNLDFTPGRINATALSHWRGSFMDAALLREALFGVDTVFHLAATTLPRDSQADPERDARENLLGTIALLDMAVSTGVRRIVFCSSGGTVYGHALRAPIDEDHPTNPITAYGISKLAIEKYLRLYSTQHGIATVSLRIANPYGPFQNIAKAQGAVTTFCNNALNDRMIDIWGDGSVERDFVHVRDVAAALLRAGQSGASGTEINIGSGQGTSLNHLVSEIARTLGRPVRHRYLQGRSFDVPQNFLDISRARRVLGWAPSIPLSTGLRDLVSFMRSAADPIDSDTPDAC